MAVDATCAAASLAAGEPLEGSAPRASAWLLVEQPGPWGPRALTESALDPELGAELERRAKAVHAKVLLIRRPGRRPPARRRAFLCSPSPESPFVEEVELDDPAELLQLDLAAAARGVRPGLGRRLEAPLWLVCANGRRDPCCARLGAPLARALAQARPGAIWQCSHLGGHRFAPNVVCLPDGLCFGRVPPGRGVELVEALERGLLPLEHLRGRSSLAPAAQAAEIFLRRAEGHVTLDGLRAVVEEGLATTFAADGGRVYRVTVEAAPGPERPASCGEEPEPSERFELAAIERLE